MIGGRDPTASGIAAAAARHSTVGSSAMAASIFSCG
jgi:hypothetical protein